MQKVFKTKPKDSTLRRNLQSKFQGGGKGDITPQIIQSAGNPEEENQKHLRNLYSDKCVH